MTRVPVSGESWPRKPGSTFRSWSSTTVPPTRRGPRRLLPGPRSCGRNPNQGKGAALRAGFARAIGDGALAVITLDGDGQHDPGELPRFLAAERAHPGELVVGRRDFGRMPLVRRLSNLAGTILLSAAVGQWIPDNQSGYRLIGRRLMAAMLESRDDGFAFEVEMIAVCLREGWPIRWVPISTIYGDERSHIRPLQPSPRVHRRQPACPEHRPRRTRVAEGHTPTLAARAPPLRPGSLACRAVIGGIGVDSGHPASRRHTRSALARRVAAGTRCGHGCSVHHNDPDSRSGDGPRSAMPDLDQAAAILASVRPPAPRSHWRSKGSHSCRSLGIPVPRHVIVGPAGKR